MKAGIVAFLIAAAVAGGCGQESPAPTPSSPATLVPASSAPASTPTTPAAPSPTPAPSLTGVWITVASFANSRDASTDTFTLKGGEERYQVWFAEISEKATVTIFSTADASSPVETLEFTEAGVHEPVLHLGSGEYYLDVHVSSQWAVAILERQE